MVASLPGRYEYRGDAAILALPRGGVPFTNEVKTALNSPLDVFLIRNPGVPGHEELATRAIANAGMVVINDDLVSGLGICPKVVQLVADHEGREFLQREVNPAQSVFAVPAAPGSSCHELSAAVDDVVGATTRLPLTVVLGLHSDDDGRPRSASAIRVCTERQSHCFLARLVEQFDVVIHIDETRADGLPARPAYWDGRELSLTFPHAV